MPDTRKKSRRAGGRDARRALRAAPLVMAACAQLCNHYGFITSMASGMTDSKTMDAQAGYEKAITTTALALMQTEYLYPEMADGISDTD